MGKSTSNSYDAKKALAVEQTAADFRVSTAYVRMIVNGNKDGGQSEEIRRAYNLKYAALARALSA